jgi:hypothetical protein
LKTHFTISVSGDAPLTVELEVRAVQKMLKDSSLMRCQTELKGAEMTADSVTEVEVGIREDIFGLLFRVLKSCEVEFGDADEDEEWWCDLKEVVSRLHSRVGMT